MTSPSGYGSGSIITPEAVLLDFELAGIGSRSVAFGVDFFIQFVALFLFFTFAGILALGSELVAIIILLVGLITIILGYPVFFEVMNGGRTLGRMVVGTRVVTVEGAPVRFRQAFIRSLLAIVDLFISAGAIGVVSALVTKRGQRLGDLVAGTMVVREPKSTGPLGALYFWPPGYLVEWSQIVDVRALGNDAYQLIRDFLSRTDLAEPARSELADDLALLVSTRLPHAARPNTVPSVDYLTAIAAATQGTAPAPPPPPGARPHGVMPPPPGAQPNGVAPPPPTWANQPPSRGPNSVPPPPGVVPRAPGALPPPPGVVPRAPGALPPPPGVVPRAPGVVPPPPGVVPRAPGAFPPPPGVVPRAPASPAPPVDEPSYEPPPNDGGFAAPG